MLNLKIISQTPSPRNIAIKSFPKNLPKKMFNAHMNTNFITTNDNLNVLEIIISHKVAHDDLQSIKVRKVYKTG